MSRFGGLFPELESQWSSRLESKLALSEFEQTYRFVTGNPRKDKSPQYTLALSYKMRGGCAGKPARHQFSG